MWAKMDIIVDFYQQAAKLISIQFYFCLLRLEISFIPTCLRWRKVEAKAYGTKTFNHNPMKKENFMV